MSIMNIALTNLGQYVEGTLNFTWLSLPATIEEIQEAHKKIQVAPNTRYEEAFITDYECDFYEVGEYESVEALNEIAEKIEELDEDEQFIVKALMNDGYGLDEALDIYEDCRLWTDCNDMTDVAYQLVDECGLLNGVPEQLQNYFDYEAYGRDLGFEGHWIETEKGMLEVIR